MKVLIVVILAITWATASDFNSNESEIAQSGRILNGQVAGPTQFPHIVGLDIEHSDFDSSWCAGSIIDKNWILTTAHCLADAVKVHILLGASNREKYTKKITVKANHFIIHKNYTPNIKSCTAHIENYDIGLIKVTKSLVFTDHIQRINLPEKGNSDYGGEKVVVAGWGAATTSTSRITHKLRWGHMKVMSNDESAKLNKNLVSSSRINTKAIEGVFPSVGDAGGPLVLESSPNVLIGVLAVIPERNCDKRLPAIFSRVQTHLDWIKKKTKI